MDDLEDGEVVDSDSNGGLSEKDTEQVNTSGVLKSLQPDIVQCTTNAANKPIEDRFTQINAYRCNTSRTVYSDESDVSSDEDSDLWNCKRAKYLSSQRSKEFSSKHSGPNFSKTEHFIHSPRKPNSGVVLNNSNSTTSHKKKNNIWGAVIQEQTLSQGISGFSVDKRKDSSDRSVESYDYTNSKLDCRPRIEPDVVLGGPSSDDNPFSEIIDLEPEACNHGIKRKRPAKSRIGKRTFDKSKSRDHIGATAQNSVTEVVNAIAKCLNEPKVDLLGRVVSVVGNQKALELMYLTEDVEESGGMYVVAGDRRRTPGGVYLQLLKMDQDVTKAQIKEIFALEEKMRVCLKKKAISRKIKKRVEKKMEDEEVENRRNGVDYPVSNLNPTCFEEKVDDDVTLDILPEEEISLG